MTFHQIRFSSGIPSLDDVLKGILPGDNVVFHVDSVDDYRELVTPFYREAVRERKPVIYFRFGTHDPLVLPDAGVTIYEFSPDMGFEKFIYEIHTVIENAGKGVCYVFDCLTTLVASWYSDRMLGNFFMLTCPYLFDLDTVAYFALLRNEHSYFATTPIAETTQILVDVFRKNGVMYIHPRKVQQRHSSTMYMLHERRGDSFEPVPFSGVITDVLKDSNWSWQDAANYRRGFWTKTFNAAEKIWSEYQEGRASREEAEVSIPQLLRMMISRNDRILEMAGTYLDMEDILWIRGRMLSTGLIGGKAVGMVLARAILKKRFARHDACMEDHDSFFIGTDLFCTYLVQDGCWWMKQRQRDDHLLMQGAEDARMRILTGHFPEQIRMRFADMLSHFGQSPIIVRSSSLLEDNFGNAFAGKYESIFLPNQGNPEERLDAFILAVKKIFASTLSKEALMYRRKRGILNMDEEMGLLVQRVSGCSYGTCFFPHLAGVGLSHNPYVWNESIDPKSGMIRLVFGLGTRAVDRSDDDCTRIVALNAPGCRAEFATGDPHRYAQRKVDLLDLNGNSFVSRSFEDVISQARGINAHWFAARDRQLEEMALHRGQDNVFAWSISFDRIFSNTKLISDMKEILSILQESYAYPVEVEFTVNFLSETDYRINLLQCRPLQIHQGEEIGDLPEDITSSNQWISCRGPVIGRSRQGAVSRIVYVVPSEYARLSNPQRYQVAEIIGRLTHHPTAKDPEFRQMLIGPGRWGTTTPALGIPITFAQINTVQLMCEIVTMSDNLVPDVSLGTHFFNELVECDMMYMAVFPTHEGSVWSRERLEGYRNSLPQLLPEFEAFSPIIRVLDSDKSNGQFLFYGNALTQMAVLYQTPVSDGKS